MQFFGCNISNRKQLIVRHIEKFNVTWVKRGFGWPIFGLFLDWIDVFFANFARMNKTLTFILFLCVTMLAGLLPGCHRGGAPRYDSRLVHADSVLRSNDPDSALRLLTAIDGRQLSTDGDRAYHALLLTQAQYRCYVDITSDSTINEALDYYKRHDGEHEKLTRCYIYKGAVTEVLGDPEEAMNYYKKAASVATPDEHFNLGYAKMRIGSLYRDYLVKDSSDITFLKQALNHFRQVPDSFYIAQCLSTIGSSYSAINRIDSALVYLEQADTVIKALNMKSMEILNQRYLADAKMFSHDVKDIEDAKNIAVSLANQESDERNHLLLAAAYTLAKLNKADSASFYFEQVEQDKLSDGLRVLYNDCQAELARCHGDVERFKYFFARATQIGDSLNDNAMQMQLRDMEAKYDNEALKHKALRYKSNWLLSLLGALLAISILAIALMMIARKAAERKRQIAASEETIERLHNDALLLTEQLNAHQAMSDDLKQAIRRQIDIYGRLVEQHSVNFADSPGKFSKAFERSYRKCKPDGALWASLRTYANSQYNDIIDKTVADNPTLGESDIHYLTLYCCGLPTSVIMAFMGYNEAHSAYNKKRRVAEALGTVSLDAYIQLFLQ